MSLDAYCRGRKMIGLRDVYAKTLIALAERDPDIVVLDADLSGSTRTAKFAEVFRERFFNMGISEQDLIGTAAGLALAGKKPFVSTFAIFETGRAWEQVRQSVCLNHVPVKLVASHGGVTVGEDGPTHHCTEDFALMRVLPGMTVVAPMDAEEMGEVIQKSLSLDGPLYVRGSREKFPIIERKRTEFEFGKGNVLRDGDDIAIVACGLMVDFSYQAAAMLCESGVEARVIGMSTIKPIDEALLISAAEETGLVLTVEEHSVIGGLGSAVCEVLSEKAPVPVMRLGVDDRFTASATPCELLELCGLTPKSIAKSALDLHKKHGQ